MRRRQRRVVVRFPTTAPCRFRGCWMPSQMPLMLLEHALRGLEYQRCGEKSETSEHGPIISNKTAGRGCLKQGSGRPILVFPTLPETPNGSMRQISESPSTPLSSCNETAGRSVVAFRYAQHSGILPHTSDYFFIPFVYLPTRPCLPRCLR